MSTERQRGNALVEASWDETWHVLGIDLPRVIEVEIPRKRVRLVPFDMAAFPRLAEALSKDDLERRSFSPPSPVPARAVHPVVASLFPLVAPHARKALGLSRIPGDPPVGGTFVGGGFADIGDWPAPGGVPLLHVLQIGRADAAAIGLSHQINVFTGRLPPGSPNTPVLEALGVAPLFGSIPRGESPFLVLASAGGSRRQSPGAAAPAVALGRPAERIVYPSQTAFHSEDDDVQGQVAAFVTRVYVVDSEGYAFAPDLHLMSVQHYYRMEFPSSDDLLDDVLLGGIAPPLHNEASPCKRLASLRLDKFPEIRRLIAHGDEWLAGDGELCWQRWAIDWSPETSPQSWAYGR